MQSNPNREEKNVVEIYDWNDTGHTDNYPMKRYCRRLRRKRQKRILDKDIQDAILKA